MYVTGWGPVLAVGYMIELAHSLGRSVVAEGIESEAVCVRLRDLGCDIGQGFYLGRPVAGPALMDRLWEQVTQRGVEVFAGR
jgi:EAL domain-containing protein (putative c-di-GMP-specific phosphodiesterase class I)